MNFFDRQEQARKNTRSILGLFVVAIAAIIVALYGAVVPLVYILWQGTIPIRSMLDGTGTNEATFDGAIFWTFWVWWTPKTVIIVSLLTLAVVGSGSLYKWWTVHRGGQAVAESLGGQLVLPNTKDPDERTLNNVVEEMAISSGIGIPQVYVLHEEAGINAFAAGFTSQDAVISVTQGCLKHLKRDELQGVIGHEFSHILNGDMKLNMHLIAGLHGIDIFYIVGRWLAPLSQPSSERFFLGSALAFIGRFGLLFGRLIQRAVSRQREFLADASAVQFTRHPEGLANALIKIADQGSQIDTPEVESASHLFFSNAISTNTARWWATHPPLEARIKRLGFKVPAHLLRRQTHSSRNSTTVLNPIAAASQGTTLNPIKQERKPLQMQGLEPQQVINAVGNVAPEHLTQTQFLVAQLPDEVRQALRNREDAIAIIYALLLDCRASIQVRQFEFLLATESEQRVQTTRQMYELLLPLEPRIRLPLLDLAIPALRQSSLVQFQTLLDQVDGLINCDGQCSLAEYSLRMILSQRLQPYFDLAPQVNRRATMSSLWPDCVVLLTALAHVGHSSPESQLYALQIGLQRLPGARKQILPTEIIPAALPKLSGAIERLAQTLPNQKQAFVDACAHTVLVDGAVTLHEAELLRAIVIALNCPLPLFLNPSSIASV